MGKGQRWAAAVCREAGAEPLVLVGGGGCRGLPQMGGSPTPGAHPPATNSWSEGRRQANGGQAQSGTEAPRA